MDDFEIEAGVKGEPHYHNTHEWYYILEGRAVVQIGTEARRVRVGDLIYIPPNAHHCIYPIGDDKVRSLCFLASYHRPGTPKYVPVDLPLVEPTD